MPKVLSAKGVAATVLCGLLLAAPLPAAARVTFTVQFAYGSVLVGGVGFFIYLAGGWEFPLASRELPTTLLEIRADRVRFGLPLLFPRPAPGAVDARGQGVQLDLVRWRF